MNTATTKQITEGENKLFNFLCLVAKGMKEKETEKELIKIT